MASLPTMAFCLLILTQWLTQQVMSGLTERGNSCNLDMAYNAFDDQYVGCTEEMEKKAPQLLEKELELDKTLKYKWEEAERKWKEIKNQTESSEKLSDFHGTALVAYTGDIAEDFNKAVREFRPNQHKFQLYALHYYLTRALQLLTEGNCYTVYRGSKTKMDYSGEGKVRFGQFTSSSLSIDVAQTFLDKGKGTLFTINTCLGVYIKNFSFSAREEEVLIPGYEVFEQVTIKNISRTYDEISLGRPQNFRSNFNCFYINSNRSGMNGSSAFILLLPGLLILLFSPHML